MNLGNWPITGNERPLAELDEDLRNEFPSHAYLFAGPQEVGKFTAAKEFARKLIGGGESEIRQLKSLTHPNLTVVDELWIDGVSEDFEELAKKSNFNQIHRSKTPKAKTDTISVDDLREILARVNNSHEGWQVFVIHRIERMNREAANKFLKILEEPPPRTVFLLTTDHLPLVLSTIVSRCRVVNFGNVSPTAIKGQLIREFPDLPENDRARIVKFAMGKPVRAVRLARDPDQLRQFAEYFESLRQLIGRRDPAEILKFSEEATVTTKDTKKFFEVFTHLLRSLLLSRARNPDATSAFTIEKIVELLRKTEETANLVERNVNSRLAVENLLLSV